VVTLRDVKLTANRITTRRRVEGVASAMRWEKIQTHLIR